MDICYTLKMCNYLSISVWTMLLCSVFAMKLSSWKQVLERPPLLEFLILSPVLSVVSWRKRIVTRDVAIAQIVSKGCVCLVLNVLSWWLYFKAVKGFSPGWGIQSYFAIIPLYLLGQFLSTLLELMFLPTGWHYPPHFQLPFLSKNLTEFWGNRWASWVADWLGQLVFNRFRSRPVQGLFWAFLYSGIWHEVLVNIPLYVFCGINMLGSQILYFLLQVLGIVIERKFVRNSLQQPLS